ncbi:MAG: hypothetical protein Q4F67_15695, partial [Propionibacteriaceae bacterium]|nr:hypothetical protein [Propionibacteriaceae bacterium]
MTQRNATAIARNILTQAGMEPAADLVHQLSEQIIAAQEAQYAMMRQMIESEVNMTLERMGVATHAMGLSSSKRDSAPVEDAPRTPVSPAAKAKADAPLEAPKAAP